MWQCPKCKREFKNTNQSHYCGKINTIDDYIADHPEEIRPILQKLRDVVKAAAPEAIEKISWQMPTFWQKENLVQFAAHQEHIGFYPGSEAVETFSERLSEYKSSKGAIQLPLNKPLDYELIADITRWRAAAARSNSKTYEFEAVIQKAHDDKDTAYIAVPFDVKSEFGKGRLKVHATFDSMRYDGSIVNMGVKNSDGSICYIIGIRKDIRAKIGKQPGDVVKVTFSERV